MTDVLAQQDGLSSASRRPAATPRPGVVVFVVGLCIAGMLGACRPRPQMAWDPSSGAGRPAQVRWRVEGKAQGHSLSCESRSACDLLGHLGVAVSEDEFLAGLARSDNPEQGFVGNVDDPGGGLPPAGYGVYEEPLAARLADFGIATTPVRGAGLEWLRDALAQTGPVIVWATSALDAPAPVAMRDGRGRPFTVVRGEHTYLAVGYEGGRILLLDPATGTEKSVSAARFDASWAALGRRALVLRR